MNPYDDEPTSRHGRARSTRTHDRDPGYDDYADAAEFGARARGSVGRASVGRASVPGAGPPDPIDAYGPTYEPFGQGRDPYISGPPGGDPYGDHPGGPGVPISPVGPGAGRAVVGRAAVRPVSPSGPVPGGGGPGGRGPGGRGPFGRGPWGRGPDEPDGPDGPEGRRKRPGPLDPAAAKKARRRNLLVAGFAIFIMLTGIGVVGGTYYVDSVPEPSDLPLPETTTVHYTDGSEMAKLSAEARYPLKFDEMNKAVKDAAVAAEDLTFWSNEGVDFKGVMRAAWNNFTGGQTQGASTITQQYARIAFDLQGATYSRKLREAVMAWKLDDSWSKEKILESYLNTVPFGRKAHGIEAAAKAFFGKTANASAKPEQQVTVAEAMVLMAMVKQPEAAVNDPENLPGYDPRRSAKALELSKDRWNYIKGNMVALSYLTQAEADAMTYPMDPKKPEEPAVIKYDPKRTATGLDRPTGLVVSHALSELVNTPGSQFHGKKWEEIRDGGFKIITTIDKRAQVAAEQAADITNPKAPQQLRGQPKNWQAALVAVEPGWGRILAYYGGKDGAGSDYAGWFLDENGVPNGFGKHPPGSTFKVYDLATALRRGYSMNSFWDSRSPKEFPEADRVKGKLGPIRNAAPAGCMPTCTLIQATTASLNVPFFDLTLNLGPANVLEMARDAGVDYMWDNSNKRVDLREIKDMGEVVPENFSTELGIGQFAITVMDHANGMATLAAGGKRADAHFVKAVYQNGNPVYSETIKQRGIGLNPQQIDDLNYTLSKVKTGRFASSWDSAGKTGTWQKGDSTSQNSDVWTVGYTKALASAVWVGTKDGAALKTKGGSYRVFGASYAGPIWRQFMRDAHEAMKFDSSDYQFGDFKGTGDQMAGGAIPSPTPANPFDPCMIPGNPLCPPPGGGPGGGGGGGPGGGGDGGGNGRVPVYETPPIIIRPPDATRALN